MCPFTDFAPRTALEQRAWNAAAGDGVWRFDWADEKVNDEWRKKRIAQGLVMSEALARIGPVDDDERDVLVQLLTAIEAGGITGSNIGFETAEERDEEEGS